MKVLFSPVGNTDPIKYLRDGSLLHICRVYEPDIVYLYLSHEMLNFHKEDNRYVWTLQQLGLMQNHSYDIHIIERDDLINAQSYDFFYPDFNGIIKKIRAEMAPEDTLYINMASGTPAMKSALLVLATLTEYSFIPVQVNSPQKKSNIALEERIGYDKESNWELDEDNAENFENRCVEVKCFHLMRLLKIEEIKKFVQIYDYQAAFAIAEEIKRELSTEAYNRLNIARNRMMLNDQAVSKIDPGDGFCLFPVKGRNKRSIFEYALVLDIKRKRKEYGDFIRAITPIVMDILELILKQYCGIILDDYCSSDGNGVRRWDKRRLREANYLYIFDNAYYGSGSFKGGPVYSIHLWNLIDATCREDEIKLKVGEIIEIEQNVRNQAAHEIVSVTDEWIKNKTGKNADEIFSIIKYLIGKCGFNIPGSAWNSYDNMNQKILEALQ